MKKIIAFLLFGLLAISLTACKGIKIDGDTVRIAEEKCSITFVKLIEVPYETIAEFTDNGEVTYRPGSGSGAIIYTLDDRFSYYEVEFTHQGKHDLSSLVLQPGTAATNWMVNFAPDTELLYYTGNVNRMDGLARVIASSIGNGSAYLFCLSEDKIIKCEFDHKGYHFTYDFVIGEWSYSEE